MNDEIADSIQANLAASEANLAQVDANRKAITANLNRIASARWRLIRNRRLLNRCHALNADNRRLLRWNELIFTENAALLAIRKATR